MKKLMMAAATTAFASVALASWTTYSLPTTSVDYNQWSLGHTASGEFIYGENGTMWKQDAFGASAHTQYANTPVAGATPSFISTSGGAGLIGQGGWAASSLMTFTPGNTASSFTDTGVSLQNYAGKMRDANSAYIIGGNGTSGSNNLTYVALDGSVNKTLINDISQYSCGFAMDASGNLYVGDNDDGHVYYFSKSQLDAAISGSSLEITDGSFVVDFGTGGDIGSLAVDDNGVLWGAGWNHNGLVSYDTGSDSFYNWTPGHDTTHYIVDTFSAAGSNYVGFVSADGFAQGSNVVYGFADVQAVPEPSSVILLVGGFGGMVWFRRRRKYFFR